MNNINISYIIVVVLLNLTLMINHKIQTDRIRAIEMRLSRIELLEYFKNNKEIGEGKEEKTLQKKDKNI